MGERGSEGVREGAGGHTISTSLYASLEHSLSTSLAHSLSMSLLHLSTSLRLSISLIIPTRRTLKAPPEEMKYLYAQGSPVAMEIGSLLYHVGKSFGVVTSSIESSHAPECVCV